MMYSSQSLSNSEFLRDIDFVCPVGFLVVLGLLPGKCVSEGLGNGPILKGPTFLEQGSTLSIVCLSWAGKT